MALINCPECAKQISDQTNACPYCSYLLKNHKYDPLSTPIVEDELQDKNYAFRSVTTILVIIIAIILVYQCQSNYSDFENQARANSESSNTIKHENESIAIPMSDEHENNRYFLLSSNNDHGIVKIKYMRKGVESDVYGKMEINCKKNKIRKASTEERASLDSLDIGDWITPYSKWTDSDIVSFICN